MHFGKLNHYLLLLLLLSVKNINNKNNKNKIKRNPYLCHFTLKV